MTISTSIFFFFLFGEEWEGRMGVQKELLPAWLGLCVSEPPVLPANRICLKPFHPKRADHARTALSEKLCQKQHSCDCREEGADSSCSSKTFFHFRSLLWVHVVRAGGRRPAWSLSSPPSRRWRKRGACGRSIPVRQQRGMGGSGFRLGQGGGSLQQRMRHSRKNCIPSDGGP